MKRPYIVCHMTTSIDGKVTGEFLNHSRCGEASELYYQINRDYQADAYACGRINMEGSFTNGWYPDLGQLIVWVINLTPGALTKAPMYL